MRRNFAIGMLSILIFLTYRRESHLIIVSGAPTPNGELRTEAGIYYYRWENDHLTLITQANAKTPTPQF
ncbi:MAG: hypothetical protein ACNA7Y_03725 [Gammaproteobacteria bacterium]